MKFWNSVYNWADAGYAISWPTLKRFVDTKFLDAAACEAGGQGPILRNSISAENFLDYKFSSSNFGDFSAKKQHLMSYLRIVSNT
jgi:hypothetical protein